MAKKSNKHGTKHQRAVPKSTLNQIGEEIRFELRSIVRQNNHLLRPISCFQPIEGVPEGQPRYRVMFDTNPPKPIRGMKVRVNTIRVPDEQMVDDVLNYAKSVWHLKDRLKLWIACVGMTLDVEGCASNDMHLMVCSDLANRKKHGESRNRSGCYPRLNEQIELDTSQSGLLEFYYNGVRREKELIVSKPVPIPYRIEIQKDDGTVLSDNAVIYLTEAFRTFLKIIDAIGFWENDPESEDVRLLCSML